MTHDEAYNLLEEYTAGTLPPEQSSAVEAHLNTGCDACLARLRELGEVSAALADALPQEKPSPEVRERLMATVSTDRRQSPPESHDREDRQRPGGGKWPWIVSLVSAAAAVLAIAWAWNVQNETDQLRQTLNTTLDSLQQMKLDLAAYEDATFLLGEPGMQFIDLAGVAPNEQAFGKVVVDPDRGTAIVYMYELPPTPEGMAYQLWVMREGKPTSAGVFTVNDDGTGMLKLESLPDMSQIASFDVTIEPDSGAQQPTGMMYLTSPSVVQSPE